MYRGASCYLFERREWAFCNVPYGIYAVRLDCIPDKVGFSLREVVEVESPASRVPFVEEEGRMMVSTVVVEQGDIYFLVL